jgi:hypothetical protein
MMSDDLDTLVLKELRGLSGDVAKLIAKLDGMNVDVDSNIHTLRADIASELKSVRADIASDMFRSQNDTHDQIAGLRRAVVEYHTTVIGRGVRICELEARMRRVEQHLNLPSMDSH